MCKLPIGDILESIQHCNFQSHTLPDDNFFNILKIDQKEVMICRILGYLLTPRNNFTTPIRSFLHNVFGDSYSDSEYEDANVVLEEQIDNNRRVDLVIYIGNKVYPIEVKIGAGDQTSQLYDYYQYYKRKKNLQFDKISYLTPNGYKPSDCSIGNKDSKKILSEDEYRLIAFNDEIKNWLDKLQDELQHELNENSRYIVLIKQFKEVIGSMAGNDNNIKEVLEVLKIVEEFEPNSETTALLQLLALNYNNELWYQIRDKYLCKALTFDKEKYRMAAYSDPDKKGHNYAIYVIDRIADGERIATICICENLYIVSELETDRIHRGSDGGYWEYIAPTGYRAKKFSLRNPNLDICREEYNRIELNPYLEEISEEIEKSKKQH